MGYNINKIASKGNKEGFTLVELLVVVAVIGIILAIVFVSFSNPKSKARDQQRIENLKSIQTAMELCHDSRVCGGKRSYITYEDYEAAKSGGIGDFLSREKMPSDPLAAQSYNWVDNTSDSQTFCVVADLENDDPDDFYYVADDGSGGTATNSCP